MGSILLLVACCLLPALPSQCHLISGHSAIPGFEAHLSFYLVCDPTCLPSVVHTPSKPRLTRSADSCTTSL
ncbi:uncharacterized protein V1516DRAFT_676917 [Lipomyces oligophaga]|uniref:uncharacterized protein n=1 Tax=Lipomyces oligophaga TaxID=45792 RepID=UPI0034CD5F1A